MAEILTFNGNALANPTGKERDLGLDYYWASDELVEAVNLALALQYKRPLLLMGEPGCGKTRLAEVVAYELHGEKMNDHYFRWDIKSTTKAKDGIYQYDALKRLYHANLGDAANKQTENIEEYIEYGKLANAFTQPQNGNKPNILLIDEIDKADIDFPNDLLLELENKTFFIKELGEKGEIKAQSDVLVIITSNQEKELPPAFLRRCIFHFINFPEEQLANIVEHHIESVEEEVVEKALELFAEIRENLSDIDKKPSTSELIDWFKMIDYYTQVKTDQPNAENRTATQNRLIEQLDLIDTGKIPFKQVLLKTIEANQKIENDEF